MNRTSLAQRLTLTSGALIALLLVAAGIVWLMMARLSVAADRIN
ncbi:hypothetical protein [Hydrogenophaga sp. OTU3427]